MTVEQLAGLVAGLIPPLLVALLALWLNRREAALVTKDEEIAPRFMGFDWNPWYVSVWLWEIDLTWWRSRDTWDWCFHSSLFKDCCCWLYVHLGPLCLTVHND